MRILVDTNRIISSLIKDGITRRILLNEKFKFLSPEHILEEIEENKKEILIKTKASNTEFEILLSLLFENIEILPESQYVEYLSEAKTLINDMGDIPFIALALSLKVDGIWSEDKHFLQQNKIKIFSTKEMLELI